MFSEAEGVDTFKIKGTMIKVTMTMMMLIGYVRIVCEVIDSFQQSVIEVHLDANIVAVVEVKHML